ncbi:hypothetical protein I553_0234 [Mycobacterium xenopi 4042]|uniref:Uncharacterized protein n=1 Tax=Mycobacterium xenopi 4042 TaxID=1299334 RepID=X7YJE3_MYCXE|nr:hypothetical protein I553_0234 [Mycobacterium xenopi 4042]
MPSSRRRRCPTPPPDPCCEPDGCSRCCAPRRSLCPPRRTPKPSPMWSGQRRRRGRRRPGWRQPVWPGSARLGSAPPRRWRRSPDGARLRRSRRRARGCGSGCDGGCRRVGGGRRRQSRQAR